MPKFSGTKVKDKKGDFKKLTPALEKERKELYGLSLQSQTMQLCPEKYSKAESDFFALKLKDKHAAFMEKIKSCPTVKK